MIFLQPVFDVTLYVILSSLTNERPVRHAHERSDSISVEAALNTTSPIGVQFFETEMVISQEIAVQSEAKLSILYQLNVHDISILRIHLNQVGISSAPQSIDNHVDLSSFSSWYATIVQVSFVTYTSKN